MVGRVSVIFATGILQVFHFEHPTHSVHLSVRLIPRVLDVAQVISLGEYPKPWWSSDSPPDWRL